MAKTYVGRLEKELDIPEGYGRVKCSDGRTFCCGAAATEKTVAAGDLLWWEGPPMYRNDPPEAWHKAEEQCHGTTQLGKRVSVFYCVIRKATT